MLEPELVKRYTESLNELQRATSEAGRIYAEIEQRATVDELIELVLKEPTDE